MTTPRSSHCCKTGLVHWLEHHAVGVVSILALGVVACDIVGNLLSSINAVDENKNPIVHDFGFWADTVQMALYHSLRCLTLGPGVDSGVPVFIDIARWLALGIIVLISGKTIWLLLRKHIDHWRAGRARGHVIIVGLRESMVHLVEEYLDRGENVVVIERDESNTNIVRCRTMGASVLELDARDPDTLRCASLQRARMLISMGPDDTNADVSFAAAKVMQDDSCKVKRMERLRVVVHMDAPGLAGRLSVRDAFGGSQEACWFDYFNIDERIVEALMLDKPPFGPAVNINYPNAHVVVIGEVRQARLLVAAIVNRWKADAPAGQRERKVVTVVSDDVAAWSRELDAVTTDGAAIADEIHFIPSADLCRTSQNAWLKGSDGMPPPSMLYVFAPSDTAVLEQGLQLQEAACAADSHVRIVLCMAGSEGIADLAKPPALDGGDASFMSVFDACEKVCSPNVIENTLRERIAHAIHANFLKEHSAEIGQKPSMRPWDALDGYYRDENRSQANSYAKVLAKGGWRIVPLAFVTVREAQLGDFDIEVLAHLEHEHWMENKRQSGYVWGPERNDKSTPRTHPDMKPYYELDEPTREKDRSPFRHLSEVLKIAGLGISRNSTVG